MREKSDFIACSSTVRRIGQTITVFKMNSRETDSYKMRIGLT